MEIILRKTFKVLAIKMTCRRKSQVHGKNFLSLRDCSFSNRSKKEKSLLRKTSSRQLISRENQN